MEENSQSVQSQSSDCFSDSAEVPSTLQLMETDYESLVASTKHELGINLRKEPQKASMLNTLLKDCCSCVKQSLSFITECLSESEECRDKLTKYLSDAVSLLQLLSNFINMVMEVLSMKCCEIKAYPTAMGMIILEVFTHCKDSETLYGSNLVIVEKELKDLFKNCHELQLTYLMILEKHFEFDFTNIEEKEILVDALSINLKIGEIVQSLDVKTMAVQWKAYTSICEKYANILSDCNTFEESLQVLCVMLKMNLQTVLGEQDRKIATRSLKVSSFLLKTLQKECDIFKQAKRRNYENVVNLLFFINEKRCFHIVMTVDRAQFVDLVVNPIDCLLKNLLSDEIFANSLINYDFDAEKQKETLLGYLLTIASVMECLTAVLRSKTIITKSKIISCLYKTLPHCTSDLWDTDLSTSKEQPNRTHGLFEHLLTRTVALAFTLTSAEYSILERHMVKAILGTDIASALFSANLWVMLLMARNINPQQLFKQIVWLCTMFKKLEKHCMFSRSPQKLHLTYTISRLFDLMENDDKLKICKQFRIHDDDNLCLWTALGVKTLPKEAKSAVEEVVSQKLKAQFQCISTSKDGEDMDKLTKLMSLAATCDFINTSSIETIIVRAWSKTCLKNQFAIQDIDASTVWFYDFLEALVALTDSLWQKLSLDNSNLVRILHSIAAVVKQCSAEYKLLLTDMLCKIAASEINHSKHVKDFTEAFTALSQDSEDVRNKLFIILKQYRQDTNVDKILSNAENFSLQDSWAKIKDGQDLTDFKIATADLKYTHKCFVKSVDYNESLNMVSSGNFEFADENLFENEYFEEPLSKRVKLDNSEADVIVKRLESDAALLCAMKENVTTAEYRSRIQNVCDMLKNIIH